MNFIFEWSNTFYKQVQCVYLPCKNKIDIFVIQCPLCIIIIRSLRYSTTVTCVEWLVCSDGYNQLSLFQAGEDCCPVLWHEELPQLRGQACTGEDHRKITKEQINLLSCGLLWPWGEKTSHNFEIITYKTLLGTQVSTPVWSGKARELKKNV